MSLWDIFIIVMLGLAVFRGYRVGLAHRFTDWVGMVLSGLIAVLGLSQINALVSSQINGEERVKNWLVDYFTANAAANPSDALINLENWISNLFLPESMRNQLLTTVNDASDQVYVTIYTNVAEALCAPVWRIVLAIASTIVIFFILLAIGIVIGKLVRRFYVTMMIDRFLGAFMSGLLMMVVVGVFSAICIALMPETGLLGRAVHGSLMAPMLGDAVNVIIRGGLNS